MVCQLDAREWKRTLRLACSEVEVPRPLTSIVYVGAGAAVRKRPAAGAPAPGPKRRRSS